MVSAIDKVKNPFESDIQYLNIAINDTPNVDIRTHFEKSFDFVEKAISEDGNVLIHW